MWIIKACSVLATVCTVAADSAGPKIDFSSTTGAPQHLAAGILYGIPHNTNQIQDSLLSGFGFNYYRGAGAQVSHGWSHNEASFQERFTSAHNNYIVTRRHNGGFVLLLNDLWGRSIDQRLKVWGHGRHQFNDAFEKNVLTSGPTGHNLSTAVVSLSQRTWGIVERWYQRAVDLASVKTLLQRDETDVVTYPELQWDARVRQGSSLHYEEQKFIELRKLRISSQGEDALHRFLDLPPDEKVDPGDVPLIALGGSGGGYKVMYGFTGFISAAKKHGLWDCITWTAGVSGSCWTIAAYYTIARHDAQRLIDHYLTVASELAHPMSIHALNMVARSKRGVYFLIGPLVSKAQKSIIGLGIMDLYSTLTATYQLLSREPKGRLSRATFQWSKIWHRSGIDKGLEPMPLLAAVRRVPKYSYEPRTISAKARDVKKQPTSRQLDSAEGNDQENPAVSANRRSKKLFQYFEISPLEVGSPDLNRYVPTWAWGRTFISGSSVDHRPEQSFSLLLGQCTSAPAGPLAECIKALLVTVPRNTIVARLVTIFKTLLQSKHFEGFWGNPIRAGHDPNPFYGLERPLGMREHTSEHSMYISRVPHQHQRGMHSDDKSKSDPAALQPHPLPPWEAQGRTRLMDSGMANNLPNHILARPERGVDVFISFDASSDIHTGAAVQRLHHFAADFDIELREATWEFHKPQRNEVLSSSHALDIESRYIDHCARVFHGTRQSGQKIYIIYCPLLPNDTNPGYNPTTASFSTSTNLMWTPDQVKSVLTTAEANFSNYAIDTIKRVVRKVYGYKKKHRLEIHGSEA
ncbi:phospholipase A2 [Fusarium agapanthi]|uniref:Lysophospholipase n=1 Tax=Fusarium agapanthi TaxID=1803897 RepID=A0A9P5BEH8_9HYPO|nr:phospholipase A2 [Fusarium agapanthi]